MNNMFNKKMLDMISGMSEDELKANLEKVSKMMGGNATPENLMKQLKDNNIIQDK